MTEGRCGTPIYLGFANSLETGDLYRLRSIFLPLGKVGGKPSWLNPLCLPTTADLQCNVCQKVMAFLIQIYATKDDDPPHAFHRTIFVFICTDPECSKNNDASNMAVFRCCLPRNNPFYSYDGPMDPDLDGDVADPRLPEDAPNLCRICGCYASKKCGKCGVAWYCCREHQAMDWTAVHRSGCGTDVSAVDSITNPQNRFLFKEFGVEMDQEDLPEKFLDDSSDNENNDSDVTDEESKDARRRIADFEAFVARNKIDNNEYKTEDIEAAAASQRNDVKFERFNRVLNLNPTQILRYHRSGYPLLATDRAPPLKSALPCERCGAPRSFELQLMPHLLSLMSVDRIGKSIDWASVYIFTCSQTCEIECNGYAKEFICKQDFC